MKFEDALKAMIEGKKVYAPHLIYPIFIAEIPDSEGTIKEICFDSERLIPNPLNLEDITSEKWKIVEDEPQS